MFLCLVEIQSVSVVLFPIKKEWSLTALYFFDVLIQTIGKVAKGSEGRDFSNEL